MITEQELRKVAWQKAVLPNTAEIELAFNDGFNAGIAAQKALAEQDNELVKAVRLAKVALSQVRFVDLNIAQAENAVDAALKKHRGV